MQLIPAPFDETAFVERWLPIVLRWCGCLGGARVDPEDACHDILLRALDRLPTLRDQEKLGSWMFGITRRVLAAHRRSSWIRRWVPGLTVEAVDSAPSPYRLRQRQETTEAVQAVLDTMPDDLREVLVLCDVDERTDEEAAAMLGLSVGTAKSRLRRARERFEATARKRGLHVALHVLEGA